MTVTVSYPGVYIEEIPSTTHVIAGVSTSDTAFVDIFRRGPANVATPVSSFAEFSSTFGGLAQWSRASYGIYQFFLNGGAKAWVVRVAPADTKSATVKLDDLSLEAIGPGTWGNDLQAAEQLTPTPTGGQPPVDSAGLPVFDLVVREIATNASTGTKSVVATEIYRKLSLTTTDPQFAPNVINADSALVQVLDPDSIKTDEAPKAKAPKPGENITSGSNASDPANSEFTSFTGGDDGSKTVKASELVGSAGDPDAAPPTPPTGLYPLAHIAPFVFNIMCLPATSQYSDSEFQEAFAGAFAFCEKQRAFLIVDTPAAWDGAAPGTQISNVQKWFEGVPVTNQTDHAAVYFPRLTIPDPAPAANGREVPTEASGTVAGIYARTDSNRGTWKAPAGTQATITGGKPAFAMLDSDNGTLNELGINALRTFPVVGSVVWGARTVRGADALESEWKYVPVRRLALWMEDSLFQGTTWAVFEPNDETLWSSLRLAVGGFMNDLFRKGAFAGNSAKDAYFVKCDSSTTTPTDQANGIVNVLVGFAPLYPAEFVILQISQIAAT